MISEQNIAGLIGATVTDTDGNKIGKVGQIFVDPTTGRPNWATVATGLFGTSESFVPPNRSSPSTRPTTCSSPCPWGAPLLGPPVQLCPCRNQTGSGAKTLSVPLLVVINAPSVRSLRVCSEQQHSGT